jgi:hypothetical protein
MTDYLSMPLLRFLSFASCASLPLLRFLYFVLMIAMITFRPHHRHVGLFIIHLSISTAFSRPLPARRRISQAIELDKNFVKGYVRKGAALHGLRQYEEAVFA